MYVTLITRSDLTCYLRLIIWANSKPDPPSNTGFFWNVCYDILWVRCMLDWNTRAMIAHLYWWHFAMPIGRTTLLIGDPFRATFWKCSDALYYNMGNLKTADCVTVTVRDGGTLQSDMRRDIWIVRLLEELDFQIKAPIPYFEDNQSALKDMEEPRDRRKLHTLMLNITSWRSWCSSSRWKYQVNVRAIRKAVAGSLTKGLIPGPFFRSEISLGA